MVNLLEKSYNCYMNFLDGLNYGRNSLKYDILQNAILCLKNNITEIRYVQYFENNLTCKKRYPLNITTTMERIIAWYLSPNPDTSTFIWNEKEAPSLTTYYIDVAAKSGFNYLYFSLPQDVSFIIYNSLDMVLYNSTLPDSAAQLFMLVGTSTTSKGAINSVFRKKDVYATSTPITYKIKLF